MKFKKKLNIVRFCKLLIILYLECSQAQTSDTNSAEETFKFLEDGDKAVNFHDENELIVVLGTSGAGKSTLIQFITNNNDALEVVRVGKSLLFTDSGNKIGKATVKSKTTYPELVRDKITGNAIIDCPGFKDTRGPVLEIGESYFTKRVFESAKNVKIIYTIISNSVTPGQERQGIMDLLKHATNLMTDITKFENSTALIVTKLNNDAEYTDKDEIDFVKEFLVECKNSIENDISTLLKSSNADLNKIKQYEKMIELLNIFTSENKNNIGLFRKPKKVGVVKSSEHLQHVKSNLRKVMFDNIIYIKTNENDIQLSISDSALLHIKSDLIGTAYLQLVSTLTQLNLNIIKTIENNEQVTLNINDFEMEIKQLKFLNHGINVSILEKNIEFYCKILIKNIKSFYYNNNTITSILNQVNHFNFFSSFFNEDENHYFKELLDIMSSLVTDISYVQSWYTFLIDLTNQLATYEVQSSLHKYNNVFLNNITRKNCKTFLHQIAILNITSATNLTASNFNVTSSMLNKMNNILDIYIRNRPTDICNNGESYEVYGNFIVVSDFIDNINDCKNIKSISFFAFHTIYININLRYASTNIVIVAPNWVVNNPELIMIDISGANAVQHITRKGESGTNDNRSKGKDGMPGLPGGNAGNFFGIGLQIINSENLKIIANGGNGSNGQDGGDGSDGVDCTFPQEIVYKAYNFRDLFIINHQSTIPLTNKIIAQIKQAGYSHQQHENHGRIEDLESIYVVHYFNTRVYIEIMTQEQGLTSLGGGNGGINGIYGITGNIELKTPQKYNVTLTNNKNGILGRGGKGGKSGKHSIQNCKSIYVCYFSKKTLIDFELTCEQIRKISRPSKGSQSKDNFNNLNLVLPTKIEVLDQVEILKTYKMRLFKNYNTNQYVKYFMKYLNLNDGILKKYYAQDFLEEFLNLETQFSGKSIDSNEVLFYYELLVYAIDTSIQRKYLNSELPDVYLLRFTLITKINTIKSGFKNSIIIDLDKYIENTELLIQNIQVASTKIEIFNSKNNYVVEFKNLMEQADNFLKKEINPKIENLKQIMDTNLENLLKEAENVRQNSNNKITELTYKKRQLQENMMLRGKFGFLKAISIIASGVKPVAGYTGFFTSEALEKGLINEADMSNLAIEIPTGLREDINFIVLTNKSKQKEIIITNIDELLKTDDFGKNTDEIKKQLNIAKDSLINETNETDLAQAIAEGSSILSKLELVENLIKSEDVAYNSKTSAVAKDLVSAFGNMFGFTNSFLGSLYGRGDMDNINLINEALIEVEANLKHVSQYENRIFTIVRPMFKSMFDDISDVYKTNKHSNIINLNINKWKVQKHLKEILHLIKKFTNGFKISDDMLYTISRLEEILIMMMNLFDKIQELQYQQKLGTFIAKVNAADYQSYLLQNIEFNYIYNKLKLSIQSNLVLQQYNDIKTSFQLNMFPFINSHISNLDSPYVNYNYNLTMLTLNAIKNIKLIKEQLSKRKSKIKKDDKDIEYSSFNSIYASSHPFYIWSKENEINELLDGNEIFLKSDINSEVNAVKFNLIKLNIKTFDSELQSQLNTVLRFYDVEMTHMGNSYYKCGGYHYLVKGTPITISHSFEQVNDEPLRTNSVYSKIRDGDIVLSPYSMWSFKLVPCEHCKHVHGFDKLNIFKNKIQLELVGKGQYVSKDAQVCLQNLDPFYEEVFEKITPLKN